MVFHIHDFTDSEPEDDPVAGPSSDAQPSPRQSPRPNPLRITVSIPLACSNHSSDLYTVPVETSLAKLPHLLLPRSRSSCVKKQHTLRQRMKRWQKSLGPNRNLPPRQSPRSIARRTIGFSLVRRQPATLGRPSALGQADRTCKKISTRRKIGRKRVTRSALQTRRQDQERTGERGLKSELSSDGADGRQLKEGDVSIPPTPLEPTSRAPSEGESKRVSADNRHRPRV